jgi:UDP-glucose 4-epimerase
MILVTGGAGYIGSITVELLLERAEQVVVLDNLSRGYRAAVPRDIPFYQGNIGDRDLVARIAREHNIEACIHFAALAYVGESVAEPARYFENNVAQGIAFLGALLEANVSSVVFSSTCATYGEPQQIPISEQHPQQPTNPYGWSKLFMEQMLASYDLAYGMKFVALRYFNAAGATEKLGEDHEPETHLIPNVLSVAQGRLTAVPVFGDSYATPDGTPIRDFVHVADLGSAHVLALDYLRAGGKSEFMNLGRGQGNSVLEVIDTARQVTQQPIPIRIEPPRVGDPSRLIAHSERAHSVLGWRPAYSDLAAIIRSDWEWRTSHPHGYRPSDVDDVRSDVDLPNRLN